MVFKYMMPRIKRLTYPQLHKLRMVDTKRDNNLMPDRGRWKVAGSLPPLMPFCLIYL